MRAPTNGAKESKLSAEAPIEEAPAAAPAVVSPPTEEAKPSAEAPVEEHPQPPNPGIRQPGTPIDMLPRLDFEVDRDMEMPAEAESQDEYEAPPEMVPVPEGWEEDYHGVEGGGVPGAPVPRTPSPTPTLTGRARWWGELEAP